MAPSQQAFAKSGWEGIRTIAENPRMIDLKEQNRATYWPVDFPLFVEWLVDYPSYYCDFTLEKYIRMVEWLKDKDGNIAVDFLGRYENLAKDVQAILSALKLPAEEIPVMNSSSDCFKQDAAKMIRSGSYLKDMICTYYKEDFELFNYSVDFEDARAPE